MEQTPTTPSPEIRKPRHRAETVAAIEEDAFEHQEKPPTEALSAEQEHFAQQERIENAYDDIHRIYSIESDDNLVEVEPVTVPEVDESHVPGPRHRKEDGIVNKMFPQETHGIKMTRIQSILAGTVGRLVASSAPDNQFGLRPNAEFANPITRRILYKHAQNDPEMASYIRSKDENYYKRPKFTHTNSRLRTAVQAATVLPFMATDLLVAPLTLTGLARKDSPNKFLRGIAAVHEKFDRFSADPFASKPTLYNIDRHERYRDPFDI